MYKYLVEFHLGIKNTEYDIIMKKNIIFPFHPNTGDELLIHGDVREIESILVLVGDVDDFVSEEVTSCEIVLAKNELCRQDDDKDSIQSLIYEINEMIVFGWEHDDSFSPIPSLDDDINDIYGFKIERQSSNK